MWLHISPLRVREPTANFSGGCCRCRGLPGSVRNRQQWYLCEGVAMRHLCKSLAWKLRQEDLELQTSLGYIGRKKGRRGGGKVISVFQTVDRTNQAG